MNTDRPIPPAPVGALRFLAEMRIVETTGRHDDVLVNALLPLLEDAYAKGYERGCIDAEADQ